MPWSVILFSSREKTEILTILHLRTMREVAYILDLKINSCSNYYHNLIKPYGILKNISIIKK